MSAVRRLSAVAGAAGGAPSLLRDSAAIRATRWGQGSIVREGDEIGGDLWVTLCNDRSGTVDEVKLVLLFLSHESDTCTYMDS